MADVEDHSAHPEVGPRLRDLDQGSAKRPTPTVTDFALDCAVRH